MKPLNEPPRWTQGLLRRLTPAVDRGELLGDLEESFQDRLERHGAPKASMWYRRQAALLAAGILWRRCLQLRIGLPADFRLALRSLQRAPLVVAAAVLTLGLGIGAPATLFAIMDAILRPLPVEDPERIVDVALFDPRRGAELSVSPDLYRSWQTVAELESLGAYWRDHLSVAGANGPPQRYPGAYVTPEIFDIVQAEPVLGRIFLPADIRQQAPVALIREDVWEERFNRDPAVLGRTLRIEGRQRTVVGVLPLSFAFPEDQQVWLPLQMDSATSRYSLLARLQGGTSLQALEERLRSLAGHLLEEGQPAVRVLEYVEAYFGSEFMQTSRTMVRIFSLLVLVAAVNVASLLLARGAHRGSDIAVLMALGGGRGRIIRQLLLESFMLASLGGVLALIVASWGLSLFHRTAQSSVEVLYWMRFELGAASFGFTALLVGLSALAAGLVPALRSSAVDLSDALRKDRRDGFLRMGRLVPSIIALEVAFSCAVLLLSALIVQGAAANIRTHGAYSTDDILTARLVLEDYDYTPASRRDFVDRLSRTLEENPRLQSFSLLSDLPGKETGWSAFAVDGRDYPRPADVPRSQVRTISPGAARLFGLELLQGRMLSASDSPETRPVALVNERFARRHFGDESPLGRRLRLGGGESAARVEIVGVVSDPGVTIDDGQPAEGIFLPLAQNVSSVFWVALQTPHGHRALPSLLEAVAQVDVNLPVARIRTLSEVRRRENAEEKLFGSLFALFGLVSLLMAAVGLFGVVSFSVSQRTREIGIRRALGAAPGAVFWRTVLQGLRPALTGLVAGTGLALLLAPLLGEVLYGFNSRDPLTYLLVPLALLAICFLSASLPARRAAAVNPVKALRAQ